MDTKLINNEGTVGLSPRWLMFSKAARSDNLSKNNSAIVLVLDSKKEADIGIGRAWDKPALEKDSCYVSDSLLKYLNVTDFESQGITLSFDLISMLYSFSNFKGSEEDFLFDVICRWQLESNGIFDNLINNPICSQPILDDNMKRLILKTIKTLFTFRKPLKISSRIESPSGKYPSSLGNVIILEKQVVNDYVNDFIKDLFDMDYENIQRLIPNMDYLTMKRSSEMLKSRMDETLSVDLSHYALMLVGSYRHRISAYSKSSSEMKKEIIYWSNSITSDIGVDYPVNKMTPLVDTLTIVSFMRLILDQLLLIIQIFLIALGCYLIYALLISDIESKSYESGMLRALGIQNYTLAIILLIQSLMFSIPGIIVGLLLSTIVYIPIGGFIQNYTAIQLSKLLSGAAIGMGVGIGLFIPMLALFIPMKRALSKTLRDALDRYHTSTNDLKVTIMKLQNIGISATQAYVSLLLVVFGFLIYYVIPLSFLFLNMALFFHVFVSIIIGLLTGLSILAMVFHTRVQVLVLNLFIWGSDRRKLKALVRKNLHGHARRNKNTAFLFNICIAFVIFSGSMFQLQKNTIISNVKLTVGSDLVMQSVDSNFELALDEKSLRDYLNEKIAEPDSGIAAFSFTTFSINDLESIRSTKLSNIASYPRKETLIYGVEENFLDSVYDNYFITVDISPELKPNKTKTGSLDMVRELFKQRPEHDYIPPVIGTAPIEYPGNLSGIEYNTQVYKDQIPLLISQAVKRPLSLDFDVLSALTFNINIAKDGRHIVTAPMLRTGKPLATVAKMPGFFFSSYEQTANVAPCIVSMDDYHKFLVAGHNMSFLKDNPPPSQPPKRALFVKMIDKASKIQKDIIKDGLRNYITSDRIFLIDMEEMQSSANDAVGLLQIFLNVVSALAIILCFFVLLISFTSNVTENVWEFGVLRAIGLTAAQTIRIYIYEAFSIILSSILLGSFIGLFVSVTFSLQVNAFTELPLIMGFPTVLFILVFVMASVVAFLGSYIPARMLKKKKISHVLKGL